MFGSNKEPQSLHMTEAEMKVYKLYFKELGDKFEKVWNEYDYNPNTAIMMMENEIELSCLQWKVKLKLNQDYNIPLESVDEFVDLVLEFNAKRKLNKIFE